MSQQNFNDTTPAAPSGHVNVQWQFDASNPVNVSANVPIGGGVTFVDNETVSGSGTSWTLAGSPSPAASLQLFQHLVGFGDVLLIVGTDYTLAGGTGPGLTTSNSLSAGVLHAWYRK